MFFIYSIVMNITCLFCTWPYSCIWLRNTHITRYICSGVVNTPISMDNMDLSGLYNARHFYLQTEGILIV